MRKGKYKEAEEQIKELNKIIKNIKWKNSHKLKRSPAMKKLFLILIIFLLFPLIIWGTSEAQKSLENTLKEFQAGEIIESTDVDSSIIAPIFKKMTYKINTIKEKENEADIELTIKAVDLNIYMKEYANIIQLLTLDGATEEEIQENAIKFFMELIDRSDLKYIKTDIVIRMERNDDEWFIVNNDEIIDAITGNLSKTFE